VHAENYCHPDAIHIFLPAFDLKEEYSTTWQNEEGKMLVYIVFIIIEQSHSF